MSSRFGSRTDSGIIRDFIESYDADALAYFNANTAITSDADKNAINDFYLGLKSDGIYTKIKAMYLPIWGSAASCKWNLVNPLDTNAAYRLTFSTGWTFTSGGATPNGTSAYADSYFIPNSNLTDSDNHESIYLRTDNVAANVAQIGSYDGSFNFFLIQAKYTGDVLLTANGKSPFPTVSNADAKGFYIMTKSASNSLNAFKNGTKVINGGTTGTGISSLSVYLGALNASGTASNYSTNQIAFCTNGTKLTDTDATNFYNRVNTLMTYFGINV